MDINAAFPSKYLKASDLQGRKIKCTIDDVKTEKMGDDEKPVMYFRDKSKGLVINKTKAMVIASMYGSDTDEWKGRLLYIYPTKTQNPQGQMVDAIGVEVVPEEVSTKEGEPNF
jgi:hypothetical protein